MHHLRHQARWTTKTDSRYAVSKHSWVKITITPIHIVSDPAISAEPVVFISEADEIEAQECSQYGCIRCDETLTSETVNADCEVDVPDIASTFIDLSRDDER